MVKRREERTNGGGSAIGLKVLGERGIRGTDEFYFGRGVVLLAWDGDGEGRSGQSCDDRDNGELHFDGTEKLIEVFCLEGCTVACLLCC